MSKLVKVAEKSPVIEYIFQKISEQLLAKKRVFWLVAGGSAMDIAVQVAKRLVKTPHTDLITVNLTDERYGPVGFSDSNWKQLADKGFLIPGAQMMSVLKGKKMDETAADYELGLINGFKNSDYSIALAGMGTDGHIFGIKPGSPSVNSNEKVVAYKWDDYDRLTPTIKYIKRLDEVVLYVIGQEKHAQLDKLKEEITPNQQPAQLLKQLTKVTIFNDYMEGEL